MKILVLLPWLFVIITAQETLYRLDQLLQRGISSGDGDSTYNVDDTGVQLNDELDSNPEELQQRRKLQNLGVMFLRMAKAAGLRESKTKRPPYPPTNPYGGPVQMYTVSGGPLLPGQLIVSDFDTRRGGEVDVDTRSEGVVDFNTWIRGEPDVDTRRERLVDFVPRRAAGKTGKTKRNPLMMIKLEGSVYKV